MSGRGVIVYGSLLDTDSLAATFSEAAAARAVPVRVSGYRRCFGIASEHREGADGETAILTAEPDPDSWLNGVLVPDVSERGYEWYREREYRYDLVDVSGDAVSAYERADEDAIADLDERRMAVRECDLDDPSPIPYYAAACAEGAADWGEEFLADFLVSTHRV